MGRLLGIDYGKKRIGLAISDPLGIFATGLTTLENRSLKHVLNELKALAEAHNVERMVIGLPLKESGEQGLLAVEAQAFGTALAEALGVAVVYVDERYTSVIAQQTLRAQGIQPSRQKHLTDKTAAALILQQYLDTPP